MCHNKRCVNPAPGHLEPVTHLVNVRRGGVNGSNFTKTHCDGHEFTPKTPIFAATDGVNAVRALGGSCVTTNTAPEFFKADESIGC